MISNNKMEKLLEKIIGPAISLAAVEALGEARPDNAVIKAELPFPVNRFHTTIAGETVADWYDSSGNLNSKLHLKDGTRYEVRKTSYTGNGAFGLQLTKTRY